MAPTLNRVVLALQAAAAATSAANSEAEVAELALEEAATLERMQRYLLPVSCVCVYHNLCSPMQHE